MEPVLSTDQQDQLSPNYGTPAYSLGPSIGEAFSATWDANQRLNGFDAAYQNQRDYAQQRFDAFTAKTAIAIPQQQNVADPNADGWGDWLKSGRAVMQKAAADRNDPTLAAGMEDADIAAGGIALARGALRRQVQLSQGAYGFGKIAGGAAAGAIGGALDPLNAISLAAAPEGGPLLASALRMGGALAAQQLIGDVGRFSYRQQVDPSYGVGDVAQDVAGAAAGGALFGVGHALGGNGIRATLGAATGGAVGGAALGAMSGGMSGAVEGALGGAALPLAGAGFGLSARTLGMGWRVLKAESPETAGRMPLDVRDAGEVAEKAGDVQAQNPFQGASGEAAHADGVAAADQALATGQPFVMPPSVEAEAAVRRGQVFYPGGAIDARYDVAEHSDLITSHDADFRVNDAYPPDLQPRDRSGAPAQNQVNSIAADLQPERLGPSPEANSGAPIIGPDGVVESGNGRVLAIGRAYDLGRGDDYRTWLEQQGYDTTGMDRPVLVGVRETPFDPSQRADFAHAANGSASLRMGATEQALSDARHLDGSTLDLAKGADLASAGNRDFARAFVAKLPEGERGGLLKLDGGMSANGVRRVQAALVARAYGDPAFLSRAFDHPDPNIKAIAGAMTDAATSWARMRDAATRGDIAPGHDITGDMLQAVHSIMRARDENRPLWEVLNQGDFFQSDTTQLATRMFFRDEAMRRPAGRAAVAEALQTYADEAAKNTLHGRLFADDVAPADVLRRAAAVAIEKIGGLFDTASQDVLAMVRAYHGSPQEFAQFDSGKIGSGEGLQVEGHGLYFSEDEAQGLQTRDSFTARDGQPANMYSVDLATDRENLLHRNKSFQQQSPQVQNVLKQLGLATENTPERLRAEGLDPVADKDAWNKLVGTWTAGNGAGIYAEAAHRFGSPEAASAALDAAGIHGIEYRQGPHTHFVVFDDGKISVTHKNGEAVPPAERANVLANLRREDVAARGRGPAKAPTVNQFEQIPFVHDAGAPTGLELQNPRTGEQVQAQSVSSLKDVLGRTSVGSDISADPLARAMSMVVGDRLGKLVGDTPVYVVGPDEMRALASGRVVLPVGNEPTGFYDPRSDHVVMLDDAARNPTEAAALALHEGTHAFAMRVINESDAARNIIDHLRSTATDAHVAAGGDAADHYGLLNAHEFVSEGFSNPEFQRFLASVPASDSMVKAFGLDDAPGHSLWDLLVAAVRKIIGLAPDQHTLLDATMRLGKLIEDRRGEMLREEGFDRRAEGRTESLSNSGADSQTPPPPPAAASIAQESQSDLKPMFRPIEAGVREATAEERAAKARAFSDAKDAISYRINSDRIAQHPNGPLAGFLGILTRDIHERGGINVEAVQQAYQDRIGAIAEKLTEAYGSKWSGLKQDVAGMRDVIREVFGANSGNKTAKAVADAWSAADKYATDEAKRLGKVFTAAEDWRVPQWWESSRAQKFGRPALLADMEREIQGGGLRVFDPDTHEEANPLRMRAILDGAADKIMTDASLGGTPGASGAFRNDMRVFRFADGAAGADAYLRLMDKYGAGRGGYLPMMQAHMGKVSRELGLMRVLGPGWAQIGEKLLQDSLFADRKIKANTPPRDLAQRLKDLPRDTGKFLTSWLESPAKAEAVWQYMSGQASGVGSELMAGLLSETRSFMTSTRMGSAMVTAVPADTVNYTMAAKHIGMDMGRLVSEVTKAFVADSPERREQAARLGIAAHSGVEAALATKRFEDQFVGEKVMKRMAETVIRSQGLHVWDAAIRRAWVQESLGTIAQYAGTSFEELQERNPLWADFMERVGLKNEWAEISQPEHMLDVGEAKYLHPDKLPEELRTKLMSAIYDERQFAYLAGGSARVRATSASAKAGTLAGELARSTLLFKSFPMTMLATWGMRSAREAGAGRLGTLATLVTGMTFAGALAMQARSLLQGKDPRNMRDPYFWAESFLQGGAAGIYGDFFKEAFSRSDTSLTETIMGPLAAIPAGIQGLTSGARRAAEDGEHVNFGAKFARLLSQNVPGNNLWYARLAASRLLFDNVQRMIDPDYARSFARQQQRSLKTNGQAFWYAPGQNAPSRAPDLGAMLQ